MNIHPHSPTDIVCSIVPVTDGRSIDVYLSAPPSLPGWMDGWMDGRELTLGREGMEMDVRWLVGWKISMGRFQSMGSSHRGSSSTAGAICRGS